MVCFGPLKLQEKTRFYNIKSTIHSKFLNVFLYTSHIFFRHVVFVIREGNYTFSGGDKVLTEWFLNALMTLPFASLKF